MDLNLREIFKNTLVINVQGDQPFLDPKLLTEMINFCFKNKNIPLLTTLIYNLIKNIHNPNVVKTLLNNRKQAIYFSRSATLHIRGVDEKYWHKFTSYIMDMLVFMDIEEIYFDWFKLGESKLEECEKLEQLRLIDSGYKYETFLTDGNHISIDTKKQFLEAQRKFIKKNDLKIIFKFINYEFN